MNKQKTLQLPALEIRQGPTRVLYSFAVDGKLLPQFTTISRLHRETDNGLFGYQRPEVLSHIAEIRRYLESQDPIIPNALVVAFDESVHFEPLPHNNEGCSRMGTLTIPIVDEDDPNKPGWIVDGQQRAAAIREAAIKSFPICITGFIAASDQEQREQFILVNSTRPLPKGLVYELLPATVSTLPSLLQRRRFPATLLARLNQDVNSPLFGLIETPTTPEGTIKDNSILRMLENSLTDGVLYRFRDAETNEPDTERMFTVLCAFWSAVRDVFGEAWVLPPRRSRLTHGAGILAMGFLMDAIADRHRNNRFLSTADFAADLRPLQEVCRWTEGHWDFGPGLQRKWNEIQNTTKDIRVLSNYLLVQYRTLVWNREVVGNVKR